MTINTTFSWLEVVKEPLFSKGRRIEGVPFAIEESLEINPLTTARKCLENFIGKSGKLHSVNPFSHKEEERIPFTLLAGDDVLPSCSAGWCRSQTLHAKLLKFSPHKITLHHPHATRYGFDPYNDEYNWDNEWPPDEFQKWSGSEKANRIGFENLTEWEVNQDLKPIKTYYDQVYYKQEGQARRVYITFAANAHAILKRLNETNERLDHVVVVHIDLNDMITRPHVNLIPALSKQAFEAFSLLLDRALDLSLIERL